MQQIAEIQVATMRAADEIQSIATRTDKLTSIASSIATAVDEQSGTAFRTGG